MNNESNLTTEIFGNLLEKFKSLQKPYDYIVLTEDEERIIRSSFEDGQKDGLFFEYRIAGIPYFSFETKVEALKKALELSLLGKRVLMMKEENKESKVRKCAPELYDAMVKGGLIKRD